MTISSVSLQHLALYSAEDIHELFRLLGYEVYPPAPIEGNDLKEFDFDPIDAQSVHRAYVVAQKDNHSVYLFEVDDLRKTRLRGLAWNALQRGTALLIVTRDFREVVFVDPRFAGSPNKSNVRVNKLKVVTNDPTRHDLDTLNAIHAHRRTGQQIYDAQAEAFNVTRITKRFYDEYRQHYERTRQAIRQYNKGFPEFQNEDQADKLHAFTQRLLGRLMFLYFLQRKGWLGGDQKFLSNMFRKTLQAYSDEIHDDQESFFYYREVLEPLFFETMNTRRPDNVTRWPGVRIPYLNGGLFDQARDPQGMILLPDSLFDPYSADGLLAFFNRYNFTIAEDTPLEQDVAVDPEMLGKVFENLLEERDRGQSGSFYTPRTIVSYMCQEALAGYVEESADIPRDKTRAQFDPDRDEQFTPEEAGDIAAALDTLTVLDPAVGSGSFLIGMLNEIMRLREACAAAEGVDVTPPIRAGWKEAVIRDTLYGVDIKSEAIEIAQLRLWLALVIDQSIEEAHPLPNLDYRLMAGNSLIETVDGEPVLTAIPEELLEADGTSSGAWKLVNPQMHLFRANEPPTFQSEMLFTDQEQKAHREQVGLAGLRREYFEATPERRRELRAAIQTQERRIVQANLAEKAVKLQAQIDALGKKSGTSGLTRAEQSRLSEAIRKLEHITALLLDVGKPHKALPFFLYHLHFSEVFAAKGGFDIVIANPPYVRGNVLGILKDELEVAYPQVYSGDADLYVYFFVRGYELLRSGGHLSFITSNKYLRAKYGKGLRAFLKSTVSIHTVIDLGNLPVFDAAAYPCILQADKTRPQNSYLAVLAVNDIGILDTLQSTLSECGINIEQGQLPDDNWQISDPEAFALMQKLRKMGVSLVDFVGGAIYRGPETGLNDAFIIDDEVYQRLVAEDPKTANVLYSILSGRQVKRWSIESENCWLIYAPWDFGIENYPAIKRHLSKYQSQLQARPEVQQGRYPWYSLRRYAAGYQDEFRKPKIVWGNLANEPQFSLDTSGAYVNTPSGIIACDQSVLPYLLGILNSRVAHWFMRLTAPTRQHGYLEYKPHYVGQIPVPSASGELGQEVEQVVKDCLKAAQDNPSKIPELEIELNRLVYQLYQLSPNEIRIIEAHLAGASAAAGDAPSEEEE